MLDREKLKYKTTAVLLTVILTLGFVPVAHADNASEFNEETTNASEVADNQGLETSNDEKEGEDSLAPMSEVDVLTDIVAPQSLDVQSFSGTDRVETSVLQAQHGWNTSAYAIVVGSNDWPDALSASSLAGALNCPILLTNQHTLSPSVAGVLKSLSVENVIIVGGEVMLSSGVAKSIETLVTSVVRLSGDTRFDTQLAIYDYGTTKDWFSNEKIIVTSGEDFADALAVAPIAAKMKYPVFLTNTNGYFTKAQSEKLIARAAGHQAFNSALIIGGTARVSAKVPGFLRSVMQIAGNPNGQIERIAGENRYSTSAQVVAWGIQNVGLSLDGVAFASGSNPYDALGGAALQTKKGSLLLLVDNNQISQAVNLLPTDGTITTISFFGGSVSISDQVRNTIIEHLSMQGDQ